MPIEWVYNMKESFLFFKYKSYFYVFLDKIMRIEKRELTFFNFIIITFKIYIKLYIRILDFIASIKYIELLKLIFRGIRGKGDVFFCCLSRGVRIFHHTFPMTVSRQFWNS